MSEHLDKCSWKLVDPGKFTMGVTANRCGDIADVVLLRPNRKTDLYLCEEHLNQFVINWGIHYQVQILCRCDGEDNFNAGTFGNPEARLP